MVRLEGRCLSSVLRMFVYKPRTVSAAASRPTEIAAGHAVLSWAER